ncbi:hypothetical protein ES703_22965 [subsurface metagenome]
MLISYALLGLSLGSLITFFFNKYPTINFSYLILLFIAAIVFSFINITQFPKQVFFSPFLVLPFALGNVIITFFFRKGNSNRIYCFDLAGATFGIFFSVILIPLLKTENALLLCLSVLSLIGLFFPEKKIKKSIVFLFTIILFTSLTLMFSNIKLHFLELEKITKCYDTTWPGKVFCSLKRPQNTFFLSKDSLVARISVFNQPESNKYLAYDGTPSESIKLVCYDGYNNDIVRKAGLFTYRNDPRIPFMFFKGNKQRTLFSQPPGVLIIGTAAEGIVKSIKFLVKDYLLIDSVEINAAIVKIMQNELFYLSFENN